MLAPLDLSFFQQQFAKLDIGRNGVVFLRSTDAGRLVLCWPEIDPHTAPSRPGLRPAHARNVRRPSLYDDLARRSWALLQRQQFLVLLGVAVLGGTLLIGYLLWSPRVDACRA